MKIKDDRCVWLVVVNDYLSLIIKLITSLLYINQWKILKNIYSSKITGVELFKAARVAIDCVRCGNHLQSFDVNGYSVMNTLATSTLYHRWNEGIQFLTATGTSQQAKLKHFTKQFSDVAKNNSFRPWINQTVRSVCSHKLLICFSWS